MKLSNDQIDDKSRVSLIKLYNDTFVYGVPFVILAIVYQLVFDLNWENIALLINLLAALLFFRAFQNHKQVNIHQICFHQVFILSAVIISIWWFLLFPELKQMLYMLVICAVSAYLFFEKKATISFLIAYPIFLGVLVYNYPMVKLNYLIYTVLFSSPAIFTSKWLHQLFNNSNRLLISEKKYRSLFEAGNNAILLLKRANDKFEIFDSNNYSETVFGQNKQALLHRQFRDLSADSKEYINEICKQVTQLKNQERVDLPCKFYRNGAEEFSAEATFVRINLQDDEQFVQVLVHDVSERQKDQVKLSEAVQSFKNIVDNSPSSIFIFTDDELIYYNPNAEEIVDKYLNKNARDIYQLFPKRNQFLLRELLAEVSNKISSYTEISFVDEGVEKSFSISVVNVIYNGKNSILLKLFDITLQNEYNHQKIRAEIAEDANKRLSEEIQRHKETQRDLIENTSKLNALFESSSSLFILTIDRDLNISSFNSSFRKMMKFYLNVEVKIGDDFLNTFPIEEAAYGTLIKKFKRALRGDSVEIISHFPTDKGEIWVESFISPVKVEGQPIKEIAFIAHNITEKVENERKVMDSEANNRATVSAIPDMLFKVNKEGYFTDFRLNEDGGALLKDFAYTTDLMGQHLLDVFKSKKQGQSFLNNIKKALRTGRVHTQNFIIPFIIGKTDKKMVYENRYSRVNSTEVIVITRDVTDKVEFETRLIESVREKEILLKEVHHRVKNNLQVISSILNLQSSYVEDEKTLEIINESQNRIRSMSYIHESLYQTKDFSSIDFHDYITNLVQNLVHSYQLFSGKTKLNLDIDKVELILDQAIPCGLILNELVSNSLKYAYPEGEGGEIQIEIKEKDGKIKIRVEDFGSGLPQGFKIEESDSLGLGLVDTLVDQIDGELILKTENGTKYLIIFEKQDL